MATLEAWEVFHKKYKEYMDDRWPWPARKGTDLTNTTSTFTQGVGQANAVAVPASSPGSESLARSGVVEKPLLPKDLLEHLDSGDRSMEHLAVIPVPNYLDKVSTAPGQIQFFSSIGMVGMQASAFTQLVQQALANQQSFGKQIV